MSVPTRTRRGAVTVWFAIMLFVLIALSALVIDVGVVVLARRQMVSPTEAAAIAAFRYRDGIPATLADSVGDNRSFAKRILEAHFKRHLNDPTQTWGAGLDLEVEPGTGIPMQGTSLVASKGIRAIGQWTPSISKEMADEQDDIHFDSTENRMRVRLRRSGDSPTTAGQTFGPRVPMIFSRGILTRDASGTSASSRAAEGIAVSVTAETGLQRVATVGPEDVVSINGDTKRIIGMPPFVLTKQQWESQGTGPVTSIAVAVTNLMAIQGFDPPYSLGNEISLIPTPDPVGDPRELYVAITDSLATSETIIVAFARAALTPSPENALFEFRANWAANENASAAFLVPAPHANEAVDRQSALPPGQQNKLLRIASPASL